MTTELILLCMFAFVAGFIDAVSGGGGLIQTPYDFLTASANSKFVNLASNLGSMIFFIITKKIIYSVALPMAVCNALGGLTGARFAILRGNAFIRIFFLIVICLAILRFAYDVIFSH